VPTVQITENISKNDTLTCEIKGLKATGQLTPNGIVVIAGSQAVLTERPSSHKYPWPINMRQRLKEDGILVTKPDHLLFSRDAEFSSPSAAAAVIHGGHANGLTAWKNSDGKTLKELEQT
jgi:hypothetical protein